jgi:hypothetical protein
MNFNGHVFHVFMFSMLHVVPSFPVLSIPIYLWTLHKVGFAGKPVASLLTSWKQNSTAFKAILFKPLNLLDTPASLPSMLTP